MDLSFDLSFVLACINSFPYWPELITLFGSLTLALATSKLTARSEVLKAYREKRVETYDELISFLDAFRENPDWALCPDFYSKSLVLSNHARVYGSKGVQDAMRTMLTSLNKDYESYKRDLKDLHDKHFVPFPINLMMSILQSMRINWMILMLARMRKVSCVALIEKTRERHLILFNPSCKQFEIPCIREGND